MIVRSDKPWQSLHICGGSGGGGLGALRAGAPGKSVDINPGACRNYTKLTGQPALVADIRKTTTSDLRDFHGGDAPDVVITSSPCKGFSRCMGAEMAETEHYQDLNQVAVDSVGLVMATWPERPPPIFLFEMVPGILTEKNRPFLDRVVKMLQSHDYAVDTRVHNCGVWGGLAQNRMRVLLAARHMPQVPNLLLQPPPQRVRGIGEVLGQLPVPVPGSTEGGPMHRLPKMIPMNWVRLALIRAGKDWRDLPAERRLRCQRLGRAEPHGARGGHGAQHLGLRGRPSSRLQAARRRARREGVGRAERVPDREPVHRQLAARRRRSAPHLQTQERSVRRRGLGRAVAHRAGQPLSRQRGGLGR
jgi:site-specific DNA-cytosine methylase